MAFRGIQATNIISTTVGFTDPIIVTNKDGANPTDVGFLGKIGPTQYSGLVRDAETNEFLLLDSINLTDKTVNDVNALDASIVKGNITVGTLRADTIEASLASIDELQVNDSFVLPKGTAAQRPSPATAGMMYFNEATNMFEGYNGTDWVQFVPSTFVQIP
ncbi:hypothetical protein N9578_00865 [bacterium]|nr:hypothetical protein [bacterium]MDB4128581.1 hypothetical protein [bacterium]